ncbi:numod4 motif family protein [Vibrio crassostreae]|uniref:numod4 motif family protein n=1 Tax=Vibrio crassostreae TaxID=246167 RepID=UPI001045C6E5|nr:numod4 motif family protein [Vibrio crassostreae]TCW16935.1 hypothetical protein EDB48_11027 [Vibrio crassostreae]CAK3669873.1 Numod4 motif family protein [Vibrio crassostreae]
MKRFKNGVGRHKGKNISLIERNGQPALRVGLTKRNGRAKKKNIVTYISLCDIWVLDEHSLYADQRSDGQYVARSSTGEYLHRLIMTPDSDQEIDHVDADPLNNMRGNLRPCSTRQNNLAKKQEAVEGFYGIYHSPRGYYQAIDANGRKHGSYPDADEAARKRDEIMMEEYFHNESGEELHCFGFIHWNDFQSVYDCYDSLIMESDYYLIDEVKQATKASEHLMKEKGWTI